jgi:hypothetical protein
MESNDGCTQNVRNSIKLTDIPTLWSTCLKPTLQNRNAELAAMTQRLNLKAKRIDGPITEPYTIGVAIGYLQLLSTYPTPFLALEDDARELYPLPLGSVITHPSDADAVYLGTSIWGRLRNQSVRGGVIAAKYDAHFLRIFNMLSLHAILYINQKYVNDCYSKIVNWLQNPVGAPDDVIAENMHRYIIYAVKCPYFYQDDGGSNLATKAIIEPLL